jgi:hypothetical protein
MFGWKKKYDKMVHNYNRLNDEFKKYQSYANSLSHRAVNRIQELEALNDIYELKCKVMETNEEVIASTELVNELQDQYNARYGKGRSSTNADECRDESGPMEARSTGG